VPPDEVRDEDARGERSGNIEQEQPTVLEDRVPRRRRRRIFPKTTRAASTPRRTASTQPTRTDCECSARWPCAQLNTRVKTTRGESVAGSTQRSTPCAATVAPFTTNQRGGCYFGSSR
jgi:hypothetical protein